MIDHLKSGESIDFNEEMIDKQNTNVSVRMWEIFHNLSDRATLNKKIKAGEITRQDAYRIMRENDLFPFSCHNLLYHLNLLKFPFQNHCFASFFYSNM